ncbi:prolyl oligopeptidase family serine peptidase [Flavobacterium aquidurense]|uniref:S9 family peptidase n=1 Tax=Flavobacterium aquidurense TaxID=362413 RepID=UPI00285FE029|nr:prolyl oligopeptidase family serine peptidase [Flavobacterium aquidurense]MDR7371067.1 dipeptidyl aminopeptidase/acylaminoacyl peptidase [Flavobacterium aquidurense]
MIINNNTQKKIYSNAVIFNPVLIFVLVFILQLEACPLWGQVLQKKELKSSDYHLWTRININQLSPNAQWTSYKLSYENITDSLFVQNTDSKKSYSFPSSESSTFTNDNSFVCSNKNGLYILNLKTGKQEVIKNVKEYTYSQQTGFLVILLHPELNINTLIIRYPAGKTVRELQDADQFSLSPNGEDLVYTSFQNEKHALRILNLKHLSLENWIIMNAKDSFDGFSWQKEGKSIALFSKTDPKTIKSIFYYVLQQDKLYILNSNDRSDFPNDSLVIHREPQLLISDDMQRVFFNVTNKVISTVNTQKSNVEIWNGNDKWVYLDEIKHGKFERAVKNALWVPENNSFRLLSTDNLPKISLTGNKDFAILSNPKDYEPQLELYSPRDYYLMNLRTFEKMLFLKKLPYERKHINPSPGGNYIAYFKDKDWWLYAIKENKHINLTSNIDTKFTAKEEIFTPESVCGNPGWTDGDKEILIYDQYDIWAIKPDGSSSRRLTHGRESKIRYRIAAIPNKVYYAAIYEDNHVESYNLEKGIYLRAQGDDGKTGYFTWNNHSKEQKVLYRDSYIDQPFYNPKTQSFIFREQKFDLPPQLVISNKALNYKPFFQSNIQQQNYFWGRSELIRYQNAKGQNLKGVLIYPARYDPAKKYPMIVNIYEIQSDELHRYKNPTLYNEDGFNKTNFSAQGYFILLPDIVQEFQNVGNSIVNCVTAAVEKVLEKNVVNTEKIGLIGFSSGGYETAFTITQTNLFAAAIAGGASTDLNSLFFNLGQGTGKSEMWRFQSTYWMLKKTPYEAPELYNASSPVFHVQKVQTPLLLWTGKIDPQVDPHQSMEYYLALRRFRKKNIMLQYPAETHVLLNEKNQIDITNRMQDWFDYFLKDIPSGWVEKGIK